ncbi:Outer membrane protein beta-barrel domain-containing protein [Lutibacter agarilyticus]|uniref:Outer membrane protein beta-barrel domain-containing protein n=1 Tax=Lutibacter agarilyticus TaxID=1109740 RepID=A0A238VH51_9FLAO|nr:porin family protein [Lutibacter agarilyticus]SNR33720.1 Outer membrane protein beta-barrel domain-containing protein [Lutibacter agarilyticus]
MTKKHVLALFLTLFAFQLTQSQVLISLLLGDKLNTGKISFGLEGGYNLSNISNLEGAKAASNFNLGFYFDLLLKENKNWFVHTGVIVKSTMGANIDAYPLNDESLDNLFEDADVRRKINAFNIPILARYKFKNNLFVELGPMIGFMLKKSHDEFTAINLEDKEDELQYNRKIRDDHKLFDLGAQVGLGYQLKAMHGMSVAVKYYQGVVDINKEAMDKAHYNNSFYVVASIPIGAGEKAQAKNEAAKAKKEAKKASKEKAINNI